MTKIYKSGERFMAKNNYILGVDMGGTHIKYGLVTNQGKLIKSDQIPTPKTKKAIINSLIKIFKEHEPQIKAVGLGLPGPIDLKKGIILRTPHLPFKNTPIYSLLKKHINRPFKIDNDANCFVLAESIIGSGKNYKYVTGFTLGTGIGGGIVINKKIYHGKNNAGEFGHQFIDFPNQIKLEMLLGANRLKLQVKDFIKLEKDAQAKNKIALKFWKNYGTALGFGCVNIIKILNPEIIILGGKQAKAFKYFYPHLKAVVDKYCLTCRFKIVKSKLIDKAGIIGATMLFKQ